MSQFESNNPLYRPFQAGDICEVFRAPECCEDVPEAHVNVGRHVKVIEYDTFAQLLGFPGCYVIEFIDGEGTIWSDDNTQTKSSLRGSCPADCLRLIEVQ